MVDPVLVAFCRDNVVERDGFNIADIYDDLVRDEEFSYRCLMTYMLSHIGYGFFDCVILTELVARLKAIRLTHDDGFRSTDDFRDFQKVRYKFEYIITYHGLERVRSMIAEILGDQGD